MDFGRHEHRNEHSFFSTCLKIVVTLGCYSTGRLTFKGRVQLKIQVFWEFSKYYIELCIPSLIFSIKQLREDPVNSGQDIMASAQ